MSSLLLKTQDKGPLDANSASGNLSGGDHAGIHLFNWDPEMGKTWNLLFFDHYNPRKINSLNLKSWWFGSDDFPNFQDGILRFQPLIFRGVIEPTVDPKCSKQPLWEGVFWHPAGSEHEGIIMRLQKYSFPKKKRRLRTCKLAPLWFPRVRELLFLIIPGVLYLSKTCKSGANQPGGSQWRVKFHLYPHEVWAKGLWIEFCDCRMAHLFQLSGFLFTFFTFLYQGFKGLLEFSTSQCLYGICFEGSRDVKSCKLYLQSAYPTV